MKTRKNSFYLRILIKNSIVSATNLKTIIEKQSEEMSINFKIQDRGFGFLFFEHCICFFILFLYHELSIQIDTRKYKEVIGPKIIFWASKPLNSPIFDNQHYLWLGRTLDFDMGLAQFSRPFRFSECYYFLIFYMWGRKFD